MLAEAEDIDKEENRNAVNALPVRTVSNAVGPSKFERGLAGFATLLTCNAQGKDQGTHEQPNSPMSQIPSSMQAAGPAWFAVVQGPAITAALWCFLTC